MVILAKKTKSHEKNFTREKNFDFEIFVLKYVSKHSEVIPTKKFFDQNFLTSSFFQYFELFGRKTSPSKKNTQEKIFNFEILGLKYVLKYSESIPTKKILDQNFWTW